jgi:hypothetical protein
MRENSLFLNSFNYCQPVAIVNNFFEHVHNSRGCGAILVVAFGFAAPQRNGKAG